MLAALNFRLVRIVVLVQDLQERMGVFKSGNSVEEIRVHVFRDDMNYRAQNFAKRRIDDVRLTGLLLLELRGLRGVRGHANYSLKGKLRKLWELRNCESATTESGFRARPA